MMRSDDPHDVAAQVTRYLERLREAGFAGEIVSEEAGRLVAAVDNSLYQVLPAAVIYPRNGDDLRLAVRLAAAEPTGPIPLLARGGGTGTNGQSLTRGVVVDVSRHMNRIVGFDADGLTVTVEPGVVLGQLNAFLSQHGLFFPPTVSTATRATIGGMIATDASGKGSRIHGRTSDWVEALDVVLSDGSPLTIETMPKERVEGMIAAGGVAGRVIDQVRATVTEHAEEIARVFPRMNRGLTGYNLQNAVAADGSLTLLRVVAGSEGTLAITERARLRVLPKPRCKALAVVRYASFEATLADVGRLLHAEPFAIEVLDDKVINIARRDVVWAGLERVLGGATAVPVAGISFVEFVGDDRDVIAARLSALEGLLAGETDAAVIDWRLVDDASTIEKLWTLRERSVGLMGRIAGMRQGAAFVEDCAVPPEALPAFVREFRALLDRHGLIYGMYGHADVGCLHVRPALDMRLPEDEAKLRPISDEVAELAKRHGGLLWGEHGRGYRGEYSPLFFGAVLYGELRKIKAAFDPLGILNPGKLVPVAEHPLDRIDTVPTRGSFDRQIDADHFAAFGSAVRCNGNGVCHSWSAAEIMCPSYKATRDRAQSPNGRANLLREWARRSSVATVRPDGGMRRLEEAVHASLSTCLSCKACASQCPVQVDVPSLKARFLERYFRTRARPVRDRLVAAMETILPAARHLPLIANAVLKTRAARSLLASIGLVDLPAFSTRRLVADRIDLDALAALPADRKQRTVILVPDSFTGTFDTVVALAARTCLRKLGYAVLMAPIRPNGKSLHVLGFLRRFGKVAQRERARHEAYRATGVHVVGVEAVVVLMHRQEYATTGAIGAAPILTLDEFLAAEISIGRIQPRANQGGDGGMMALYPHCTEKALDPAVGERWRRIMATLGHAVEVAEVGCCGMAGLFGHEREHVAMSRLLFDLSWRERLSSVSVSVATGFSCRCQVKRIAGQIVRHPIEILAT